MRLPGGIEVRDDLIRDDITRKDILWFLALLAFLTFWTWFVFYSGVILK
ncbi:MAG: hypothetical protein V1744_02670 [Candidatus Altiarchaeota archaeon]